MKRVILFALAAFLTQALMVNSAFANTKNEKKIAKLKAAISRLGIGPDATIEIKLKDKTEVKGYLVGHNETQFVVMNTSTGESVPVAYSAVKQAKGNNLSDGVKFAIGIGIAIALIILVGVVLSKS